MTFNRPMFNKNNSKSIRQRFFLIVGITCSVVLAINIAAQIFVSNLASSSADNINLRHESFVISRDIRAHLGTANHILSNHLLKPDQNVSDTWNQNMISLGGKLDSLVASSWVRDKQLLPIVRNLEASIVTYDQEVRKLLILRLNAQKQHPALFYARETMLPLNRTFLTSAALALEEILEESDKKANALSYLKISATRHLWIQLISNFRMYIINRLGSFDEQSLQVQAQDIELLYLQLLENLSELADLNKGETFGLQTSQSIQDMIKSAKTWIKDFRLVRKINAGPNWRMDAIILSRKIVPLDKRILDHIKKLELAISHSAEEDVNKLASMGRHITIALWSFLLVGGVTVLLGFSYFNRSILQPIAMLTKAFKSEASDHIELPLPNIQTRETQNLIDAFTLMRKQVSTRQAALEHQALHDSLTGLPNRNLLYDRVQQMIHKMHRENSAMVLMMLDLDRFKEINDTLGHQIGDRILEQVALRLIQTVRDTDTVARLGGDEFALGLPLQQPEDAERVARKVITSLEQPFIVEGYQLFVGGSIGLALYPDHGDKVETLLQRADVAMYVAKRSNNHFVLYNPSQDKDSLGRLALSNDLRQALNEEDLIVYYQPKVNLKTGATYGVEALIRWKHPVRGFIPPDEIIFIAEHTGLIKQLTHWVLKEAIAQCKKWHLAGHKITMAINLSTQNIQDQTLFQVIQDILSTYDFPPESLVLEVTESAMMLEPEHANLTLSRLDAIGVWISIDDFGTGFSSLAYLRQLPVDELKIDKSFIMHMQNNENDAVIVRSTIDLARNLGLKVVAEGIEDAGTWEMLVLLGCDYGQGFYMSKPQPANELEQWLQLQTPWLKEASL